MNDTFENKYIDIDGTEILTNLKIKLGDGTTWVVMENNIKKIIKSKKIYLENIDCLYVSLASMSRRPGYYFEKLAYLIEYNNLPPQSAVNKIRGLIYNDEELLDFLQPYFDLGQNSDGSTRAIWRDDNELY